MSKKKNTTTPTPHDAAFRSFLANPDVARDFLELHLPAEYRQLCDLSTLKLEPATFVEPDLHQYASDILWSVKTTGGEDGYVYTLIEHQSTENLYMPFRMLRYSVAAMQLGCFENPALAAKIYTKPFPLVDITVVDDNEIMNHRRMAALTLLMKHIRHRDMMELLDKLPQVMVEISDEQVRVLIHYIVNAGDSVSPEFMRALAERLPQHEDKLMTIAERLEQKGRQEGRMEGRMEGALEKALAIACQLQKMGMTPEQIKQATGLSDDELKKITH